MIFSVGKERTGGELDIGSTPFTHKSEEGITI